MSSTATAYYRLLLLLVVVLTCNGIYAQNLYWINGPGDWDDPSHWSKNPGNVGSGSAGVLPDENTMVFIDDFSGLSNASVLAIPPGSYAVKDLIVTNRSNFTLHFGGTSGNSVRLSVFGNLTLTRDMNLTYSSPSQFHNGWRFDGNGQHNVRSAGKDLLSIELLNQDGTFNQADDLEASIRIRMHGGTWNTNGQDVRAGTLYFRDTNGSGSPLPKLLNTSSSSFYAELWDSKLTYQSLTVNGNHTIYVNQFSGSPGNALNNFQFDKIHLLEFPDNPSSGSVIEHNNFECTYCEINELIIEDTGNTRLAGIFTIAQQLTVVNPGSTIQFNGGNGRLGEVIINGNVSTPAVAGCENRTVFTNAFNDYTTLTRAAGTLTISDATINNIQTSGGATFNVSNCVLEGSSSGWNVTTPPTTLEYVWIGPANGSFGNWDDPSQWALSSGSSNGCIPSITDDVLISASSQGNLRIPWSFKAQCRNFTWTNTNGLVLRLDGQNSLKSELEISGNLFLDPTAVIDAVLTHELIFSSATVNTLNTKGVALPRTRFKGALGEWRLDDDLICSQIYVEGGTITTQGSDITTDLWWSISSNPIQYNLGNSRITVNGEFRLSAPGVTNVTVNPGTSLIQCESFKALAAELYDLQLNNASPITLDNFPYVFNRLILAGAGRVTTRNNLSVNDLVFNTNGATLALDAGAGLGIEGAIESLAASSNPAILQSTTSGSQAEVNKTAGNICVSGHVAFQDIDAVLAGVMNAPQGIDNGNNEGINFENGIGSTDLYWIGGSGEWPVVQNWSRLSGGCPSNKNPSNAVRLIFDNNSFFMNGETITVPGLQNCNAMYFYNTTAVTFDIASELVADLLVVSGGYVNMTGKNLSVNIETIIENNGVITTDMDDFTTDKLTTTSGLYILIAGSKATVTSAN